MRTDICNAERNKKECNCTYQGCPRIGLCCECVKYHRDRKELPACFFSAEVERAYDRSVKKFVEVHSRK